MLPTEMEMKKVGIISFHRSINFGSALQAFALSRFLNKHGYVPEHIDLSTAEQRALYRLFPSFKSPGDLLRNIFYLWHGISWFRKKEKFKRFLKNFVPTGKTYLSATILRQSPPSYDWYICGSDQIWNQFCLDFSPAYFLDFVEDKKCCFSYAASLGRTDFTLEQLQFFQKNLKGFNAISVRESQGQEILSPLLEQPVSVVLDPTVLIDTDEWRFISKKVKTPKKYILCYFLGAGVEMRKFAGRLHRETGLPLLTVRMNLRDIFLPCKKYYGIGPQEFLYLLDHAEFVCTGSFHAVIFSILFRKKFWAFVNLEGNDCQSRLQSLLTKLNLTHRILKYADAPVSLNEEIDFKDAEMRLAKEIKYSAQWLLSSLQS